MRGSIQLCEIESSSLVGNPLGDTVRRLTPIYLPPRYADERQAYPVVYFLHGFMGSGLGWLNVSAFSSTVPERVDELIGCGAVSPFIAVFVDGWTSLGGSQWINSDACGRYQDYVTSEVIRYVDRKFRTVPLRTGRAVVGKSSGGYGAWVMGCECSSIFAHIGVHSADAYFEYCYLPDFPKAANGILKAGGAEQWVRDFWKRSRETKIRSEDPPVINIIGMSAAYSAKLGEPLNLELPFELPTGRVRSLVWERWLERDPVRFVPRSLQSLRELQSIFIDCGTRDEFHLQWGTRMLVEQLRTAGIEHLHEEFEDGHMGINYRFDRSLLYLVPRLGRQ